MDLPWYIGTIGGTAADCPGSEPAGLSMLAPPGGRAQGCDDWAKYDECDATCSFRRTVPIHSPLLLELGAAHPALLRAPVHSHGLWRPQRREPACGAAASID